jgi:hypothetical protein
MAMLESSLVHGPTCDAVAVMNLLQLYSSFQNDRFDRFRVG